MRDWERKNCTHCQPDKKENCPQIASEMAEPFKMHSGLTPYKVIGFSWDLGVWMMATTLNSKCSLLCKVSARLVFESSASFIERILSVSFYSTCINTVCESVHVRISAGILKMSPHSANSILLSVYGHNRIWYSALIHKELTDLYVVVHGHTSGVQNYS